MKHLLLLFLLPAALNIKSQSFAPSVFNSGGGTGDVPSTSGVISVYYSIGETVYEDVSSNPSASRFTQGFLQPEIVGYGAMQVTALQTTMSCYNSDDASMMLEVKSKNTPYSYRWFKNGVQLSDTSHNLQNLAAGNYSYSVTDANGIKRGGAFTVFHGDNICDIVIHNGVSPNGDGRNDVFIIEHIEDYPDTHVGIYNRWGGNVWQKDGYNNTSVAWDGSDHNGTTLPGGTYFYIVEVNKKKMTGWIELMR